jgi:hypothetical protein
LIPLLSNSKLSFVAGIVNPSPTPHIILALDAQRNTLNETSGGNLHLNSEEPVLSLVYCLNILCHEFNKGRMQQHRQFVLSCFHTILQLSDSPILWSLAVKYCCSWLTDERSPLSSTEQVDLFRNIVNLEKWSMEISTQGSMFRLVALIEQIAAHHSPLPNSKANAFKRSYPLKSEIPTALSLGSYSFLSCNRELRKLAIHRFFRTNNLNIRDSFASKFIHLLKMNWKPVENRYWLACIPSILLMSSGTDQLTFSPLSVPKESSRMEVIGGNTDSIYLPSTHPYFDFALALGNQPATLLIESLCELSYINPAVGDAIWQGFLQSHWGFSSDHVRQSLCHELSCHISRHDYINLSWPSHPIYQNNFLPTNIPAQLMQTFLALSPQAEFSYEFLGAVGSGYGFWHESCQRLMTILDSNQFPRSKVDHLLKILMSTLSDIGDIDSIRALSYKYSLLPATKKMFSYESYANYSEEQKVVIQAIKSWPDTYEDVKTIVDSVEPFEVEVWEERWIDSAKKLSQWNIVSDYCEISQLPALGMEAASMKCDWATVKKIRTHSDISVQFERNNCYLKLIEAQSHITDQKLSLAEKSYSSAIQMALIQWSILPPLLYLNGSGNETSSHKNLLHFFHRVVEVRDSMTMMNEIGSKSSKDRNLPDFKSNLVTWRDRLPDSSDNFMKWEQILQWRTQLFQTVKNMYHAVTDEAQLASLHDNSWTIIALAKQARKHNLLEVNISILSRLQNVTTMDIFDAYTKLREEIMISFGGDMDTDSKTPSTQILYHGINIINSTNLEYFSPQQKAELIRLKALLQMKLNLITESKQSLSHCVQMCPTYSKSWITWGDCYYNEYYRNTTTTSDILSNIQVIEDGQCIISCLIKGIESNSDVGRIQLSRIFLMLMSHDENISFMLTRYLVQEAKHIPTWVWIPFLPILFHLLLLKQREFIIEIVKDVALHYPQSISHLVAIFSGKDQRAVTSDVLKPSLDQLKQLLKLNNENLYSDVNYFYGELDRYHLPFQSLGRLLSHFDNLYREVIDSTALNLNSLVPSEICHRIMNFLKTETGTFSVEIQTKLHEEFSFCFQKVCDFKVDQVHTIHSSCHLILFLSHSSSTYF